MAYVTEATIGLAVAIWAAFSIWTLRSFCLFPNTSQEMSPQQRQARRIGLTFFLVLLALHAAFWFQYHLPWSFTAWTTVSALYLLPVCLWAGRLWLKLMEVFFGRAVRRP